MEIIFKPTNHLENKTTIKIIARYLVIFIPWNIWEKQLIRFGEANRESKKLLMLVSDFMVNSMPKNTHRYFIWNA